MSNVIVCYKWVFDEADIKINTDLSVDLSKAKEKISDYDKNAIALAVQSARALGGKAIGLTFGTKNVKKSLKDALSRGLDEAFYVITEKESDVNEVVTAKALAAAIQRISDVALVICSDGASDTYAHQTAPRIGVAMDLPVITSVSKIEITANALTAVRKLEECLQTVKVELPAVIAVLPEISDAPIPGLKAVLAAGKKAVTEFTTADMGFNLATNRRVVRINGYISKRKKIIFKEGETARNIHELLSALRKEGVL
jgi:electron transfer flavoprotein beta subunit